MVKHSNTPGFTLTELLVVVAIIGVLAAIAYPSYRDQVAQARRGEMQSDLMAVVQYFERRHAATGCYNAGPDNDCTTADDAAAPPFDGDYEFYTVTIEADSLGSDTYRLIATPKEGTSQEDDGELYIDQAQRRFWNENNNDTEEDAGEDNWHRG